MITLMNKTKELLLEKPISILICTDMDETYIPHDATDRLNSGIKELENFLVERASYTRFAIGWITGSNLESVIRKANGYISIAPHFICCSLGTELYWIKNGKIVPSRTWLKNISETGFDKEKITELVKYAISKGIGLVPQPDDFQGDFKVSYYYEISENQSKHFEWIECEAKKIGCRVIFTQCNPAAGDPDNTYDVEFIPVCCGKDKAVDFLVKHYEISREQTFTFGDSCNDLPMFSRSGNPFLVGNADPKAYEKFPFKTSSNYCYGIKEILEKVL